MKNTFSRNVAVALIALSVAIGFTSCNRGYGCPYELKAPVSLVACIK